MSQSDIRDPQNSETSSAEDYVGKLKDHFELLIERLHHGEPWRDVVDKPLPESIRKTHPRHDPDSLIIQAWTARRRSVAAGDDWEVIWANDALRYFLLQNMERGQDGSLEESVRRARADLYGFCRRRWRSQTGSNDEDAAGFDIERFFVALGHKSGKPLQIRFLHALLNAQQRVLGRSIEDVIDELKENQSVMLFNESGGKLDVRGGMAIDVQEYEVEIFLALLPIGSSCDRLILGARAQRPDGIPLPFEGRSKGARWCDLFGVWHINQPDSGIITPGHLPAVQGLFIPVDKRHAINEQQVRTATSARIASLASRNLSHNLGSHAMQQIARDLREPLDVRHVARLTDAEHKEFDAMPIDDLRQFAKASAIWRRDIAAFLDYLTTRSELIAMIASSTIYRFSVSQSLREALTVLRTQSLLQQYLCSPRLKFRLSFKFRNLLAKEVPNLHVDMRGGAMGVHALYAILENFARNSAKHTPRDGGEVDVLVSGCECLDGEETYVRIELSDRNAPRLDARKLDGIVADLTDLTKRRFVDRDSASATTDRGQGIIEMKAWAAYLAGVDFLEQDEENVRRLEGLLQFKAKDGRLAMAFNLPVSQPVIEWNADDIAGDGPDGKGGYLLIRVDGSTDETRHNGRRQPIGRLTGRWVIETREDHEHCLQTAFGKRHGGVDPLPSVERSSELKLVLQLQNEWLHGLARYTMQDLTAREECLQSTPQLHLIINDQGPFNHLSLKHPEYRCEGNKELLNVPLPFEGISAWVAREESAGDLAKCLQDAGVSEGFLAIWDRHLGTSAKLTPHLDDPDFVLRDRIIHYEDGCSSSDYKPLFHNLNDESRERMQAFLGKLAEAALTRVLVVDERLAAMYRANPEKLIRARRAGVVLFDPWSRGHQRTWPELLLTLDPAHPDHAVHWPAVDPGFDRENARNDQAWHQLMGRYEVPHTGLPAQQRLRFAYKSIHRSLSSEDCLKKWARHPKNDPGREHVWDHFLETWCGQTPFLSMHSGGGGAGAAGHNRVPTFALSLLKPSGFDAPCKLILCESLYRGGKSAP